MNTRDVLRKMLKPRNEGDYKRWNAFIEKVNNKIFWYPSAGVDFWHLYHYKQGCIKGIFDQMPLFIHSDNNFCHPFQQIEPYNENSLEFKINSRIELLIYNDNLHTATQIENQISFNSRQELIQSWEETQERNLTAKREDLSYIEDGYIYLFNVDVNVRKAIIRNISILYFFWDNIRFLLQVSRFKLPIFCILLKRDCMEEKLNVLWESLAKYQDIKYLLLGIPVFQDLYNIENRTLTVSHNDIIYATFWCLRDNCQWNDSVDTVSIFVKN